MISSCYRVLSNSTFVRYSVVINVESKLVLLLILYDDRSCTVAHGSWSHDATECNQQVCSYVRCNYFSQLVLSLITTCAFFEPTLSVCRCTFGVPLGHPVPVWPPLVHDCYSDNAADCCLIFISKVIKRVGKIEVVFVVCKLLCKCVDVFFRI